ncbi:hypothetical protein ACIO6T_39605 [Streptomyces sp. NPDC087532]|uniref:hypothetical protein n=1 Tax=Streptomyces sp. NPDC087532 TaxID=3365795 RepID=UPI00380D3F7F
MRELHRTNLRCATDALGTAIAQYALPLIVLAITGSVSRSGIAFIAKSLPRIAILPVAGALVDRIGGRIIRLTASPPHRLTCPSAPPHSSRSTQLPLSWRSPCTPWPPRAERPYSRSDVPRSTRNAHRRAN